MITANATTNHNGDRLIFINGSVSVEDIHTTETKIWSRSIGKYKSTILNELLNTPDFDMLARSILENKKYSVKTEVTYAKKCAIKSIFIGKEEYRSTTSKIYKRVR